MNCCKRSFSVDEDSRYWKAVLQYEQMDWEQYRADSSEYKTLSATYNIGKIPLIVLFDEKAVELKRFDG